MMNSVAKVFDCVELKEEVQARLREKYAGMGEAERFARLHEELLTAQDPLARWWREMRSAPQTAKRDEAVEN